jgi:hypothetical protein
LGYNPLAKRSAALTEQLESLREQRASVEADLAWNDGFDPAEAAQTRAREEARCNALQQEHVLISGQLSSVRARVDALERSAQLGWNPGYWFSQQRAEAKDQLPEHQNILQRKEQQRRRLASQLQKAKKGFVDSARELEKFETFDRQSAIETIANLDAEIPLRQLELDDLEIRKANVDRQQKDHLRELKQLKSRKRAAEKDLAKAEALEWDLSHAANGYEQKLVHGRCDEAFGISSPRNVIRGIERAIQSHDRNIRKLEKRLEEIAERAARDIRAIVIDGSNLCYEGHQFIGLAALKPLCRRLAGAYDVTVVFDASIRRKLGVSDNDLRQHLPDAKVHVVASRGKADETVLDAARDTYVYVLSNDRYSDFRDKPAVRQRRLIRHEIINGRVLVHDLEVDEPFVARS